MNEVKPYHVICVAIRVFPQREHIMQVLTGGTIIKSQSKQQNHPVSQEEERIATVPHLLRAFACSFSSTTMLCNPCFESWR
jgi:L-asparaginase/Glu-tRNA(Gln) amidotransferase subunit D